MCAAWAPWWPSSCSRTASQPDPELTKRVCAEGLKRGLVLLSCGVYANVIRILVPLTASDALLDEGLAILGQAFEAAQA